MTWEKLLSSSSFNVCRLMFPVNFKWILCFLQPNLSKRILSGKNKAEICKKRKKYQCLEGFQLKKLDYLLQYDRISKSC